MSVCTAAENEVEARTGDGPAVKLDLHEAGSLVPGLSQLLFDAKFSVPPPRPDAVSRGDLIKAAHSSGCRYVAVTAPAG